MTISLTDEIAMRLRAARKVNYPSARLFANAHDIAESTYCQHENGKRGLCVTALWDYGSWLGIDPGWLLTGKGLPYPNDRASVEKQAALFEHLDELNQERLYQEEQRYLITGEGFTVVDMCLLRQVITKLVGELQNTIDIEAEMFLEVVMDTYNGVIQTSASLEDKEKMVELSVQSLVKGLQMLQQKSQKAKERRA